MVSRHGKIPFPFFFFLPSFLRFFFLLLDNGQTSSLHFGVAYKQAQPLLEVRFGEGACPVGRPGRGVGFLMDDY